MYVMLAGPGPGSSESTRTTRSVVPSVGSSSLDICVFDGERLFDGGTNLRFGHPEPRVTESGHFILRLILRLRSQTHQKKTGNEHDPPPGASAAAHVLDSSTERC